MLNQGGSYQSLSSQFAYMKSLSFNAPAISRGELQGQYGEAPTCDSRYLSIAFKKGGSSLNPFHNIEFLLIDGKKNVKDV